MNLTLLFDRESDGRWIASVAELPGVHAYGATEDQAVASAQAIAFTTLANEIEHGERKPVQCVTFTMPDPVLAAIEAAPLDELPEAEGEKAAIAGANGLTCPHADVVQALECGV
jgi:predicted RNase H-like HicB family nuclease